jgi:hypothetical protein
MDAVIVIRTLSEMNAQQHAQRLIQTIFRAAATVWKAAECERKY